MKHKLLVGALAAILFSCNDSADQTTTASVESLIELSPWPQYEVKPELPLKRAMVIAFDCSGSMAGKIDQAKESLQTYVSSLPPDVEVGIVTFGGGFWSEVTKISRIKQQTPGELSKSMSNIKAQGGTPLAEAVTLSYNMLSRWAAKQEGYCQYHLVVVTDGDADNEKALSAQVEGVLKTPVQVFTIGFTIGDKHPLNMPGKTRYVSADNTEELSKGLTQILAEKEE